MADMSELVEEYMEVNHMWHMEGESGLEKLEKFLKALGYKGNGFRWGTPIESFLCDNSGAIEAVINWVKEQNIPEWQESLEGELPEEENCEACPGCGREPGEGYDEECEECQETLRLLQG